MDPQENHDRRTKKAGLPYLILRLFLTLLFPVVSFFFLSFLVGFVMVFVANSSVPSPISLHSQCKIVSSSVDLRSSKVCELGLFNPKSKNMFYPFEKSKFLCRFDYYWASIFKVEYKDHFSGDTRLALAEAPNEALPLDCRPNFGAAWLTKDRFKVNKTYDCWYTSGIPKVNLYLDGLFSCQAKDPSTIEMIRRYFILTMKILRSWFFGEERLRYWRWETGAGVVAGFSTSFISILLVKVLQQIKTALPRLSSRGALQEASYWVYLRRVCCLAAYLSFVCWFAIQYGKRLGFLEVFTVFRN